MSQNKIDRVKNIYHHVQANRTKNQNAIRRNKYAEFYKKCKVKHIVLYEAFAGRGMLCNPFALFQAFMKREDFNKYEHVWAIFDMEDNQHLLEKYKNMPNVRFVEVDSDEYLRALAEAKYIVNNSTFPNYVTKKDEQIYINTWHGIPLKTLGYDLPDANVAVANTLRNFLSADYLLSPNSFHTDIYLNAYKLNGLYQGKIIEEGQPRSDMIYHANRDEVIEQLRQEGVEIDGSKKIIMYAPTWKGSDFGNPELGLNAYFEFLETIKASVDEDEYQVFVKPHQQVYRFIKDDPNISGEFIPATVDTNSLLSVVDILVSDYSSIYFDFLDTGRPILFYIPDLEMYRNYRGVYFPLSELPGPTTKKLEDIAKWVQDIDTIQKEYKNIYDKNINWACPTDDGEVSDRVWKIVIDHEENHNIKTADTETKKKVLIYRGSMAENGITHSFMSLLNNFDYEKYDVTAYVSASNGDADALNRILSVNKNVRTMKRVGTWNADFREDFLKELFFETGIKNDTYMKLFPHKMFQREFRRCFGQSEFDYVIDFTGYSPFFTALLLHGGDGKKLIWQHNDLKADREKVVKGKRPHIVKLGTIFSMYPYFDKIVSCSESVMEVNKKNLQNEKTKGKFTFAKNTLNFDRIQNCLKEDCFLEMNQCRYMVRNEKKESESTKKLDIIQLPESKYVNFVTMGRMSTEKNHLALIQGFAKLVKEYPQARLHLIGEGILRQKIEKEIVNLNINDKVVLTGNISNPFAYMKQCQCFVLPSLHEGQPIVLLEARTLQMPLIIANFSSVKDSLMDHGQLLIDTDCESIYKGMKEYMEGNVPEYTFSPEEYNCKAYHEFERLLD
ncbi:MAG: glycosyltransferase [Anaerostipes sp.]|nr:glycosyltransferase [Anaerostipes sp.]